MFYLIKDAAELHIVTAAHPDHAMAFDEHPNLDVLRATRDDVLACAGETLLRGRELLTVNA
jgi:hypothetical protein